MNTEHKVGQEWRKEHSDGFSSGPTLIRILELPTERRAVVATVTKDGRLIRRRPILRSALNGQSSGYMLVKDGADASAVEHIPSGAGDGLCSWRCPCNAVPAPKPRVVEASLGMEEALDAEEKAKPAPLWFGGRIIVDTAGTARTFHGDVIQDQDIQELAKALRDALEPR